MFSKKIPAKTKPSDSNHPNLLGKDARSSKQSAEQVVTQAYTASENETYLPYLINDILSLVMSYLSYNEIITLSQLSKPMKNKIHEIVNSSPRELGIELSRTADLDNIYHLINQAQHTHRSLNLKKTHCVTIPMRVPAILIVIGLCLFYAFIEKLLVDQGRDYEEKHKNDPVTYKNVTTCDYQGEDCVNETVVDKYDPLDAYTGAVLFGSIMGAVIIPCVIALGVCIVRCNDKIGVGKQNNVSLSAYTKFLDEFKQFIETLPNFPNYEKDSILTKLTQNEITVKDAKRLCNTLLFTLKLAKDDLLESKNPHTFFKRLPKVSNDTVLDIRDEQPQSSIVSSYGI